MKGAGPGLSSSVEWCLEALCCFCFFSLGVLNQSTFFFPHFRSVFGFYLISFSGFIVIFSICPVYRKNKEILVYDILFEPCIAFLASDLLYLFMLTRLVAMAILIFILCSKLSIPKTKICTPECFLCWGAYLPTLSLWFHWKQSFVLKPMPSIPGDMVLFYVVENV